MSRTDYLSKAIGGLRWIGASKVIVQVITWSLTIFSVRLLTPSDYGLVSMAGLITVLINLVMEGGLTVTLIQRKDVSQEVLSNATSGLLCAGLVALAVVQLLAHPVAEFFREPVVEDILRISSLQFPLATLTVVPYAMLVRAMKFHYVAIAQATSSVAMGFITLGLAYAGLGYWSLIYSVVIGTGIRMICLWFFAKPPYQLRFHYHVLKPYMTDSAYLVGQRGLWFWVQEADSYLVAKLLGVVPLGAYSVGKSLANAPLERAAEVINQVSIPMFASAQDNRAAWLRGFSRLMQTSAIGSFPLFWGMATVAPVILPLLFGNRWEAMVLPFSILCLILPLRTVFSLIDGVLLASGRARAAFGNLLVWACITTPLLLLGTRYGLQGVAGAWLLGFPIVFGIFARRACRALEIPMSSILKPMVAPAASAAVASVCGIALWLALSSSVPQLALFGMQVAIFTVTYITVLFVLDREGLHAFIGFIRQMIGAAPRST